MIVVYSSRWLRINFTHNHFIMQHCPARSHPYLTFLNTLCMKKHDLQLFSSLHMMPDLSKMNVSNAPMKAALFSLLGTLVRETSLVFFLHQLWGKFCWTILSISVNLCRITLTKDINLCHSCITILFKSLDKISMLR